MEAIMKIDWSVQKKRGNHRPVLAYAIELEQFEIDLAVPQVVVENAISKPPSAWRSYCYPGEDERGGLALEWYRLVSPSHKNSRITESLVLPWRAVDCKFMDVKMAFEGLRRNFEAVLKSAYDSAPMDTLESLELTEQTRNHIVSGIASAKFLSASGF